MITVYTIFVWSGVLTIILAMFNFMGMSTSCGECGNKWCPIGWWNVIAPLLFIIDGCLFIVCIGAGAMVIYSLIGGVIPV